VFYVFALFKRQVLDCERPTIRASTPTCDYFIMTVFALATCPAIYNLPVEVGSGTRHLAFASDEFTASV
jgi:hypothetical protein